MRFRSLLLVLAILLWVVPAEAQVPNGGLQSSPGAQASTFIIDNIRVEGVEDQQTQTFISQTSGLARGMEVQMPAGQRIADAIRSIYDLQLFSDVRIYRESTTGRNVDLVIEVTPEPRLGRYNFTGIKGRHEDDLREKITLLSGRPVRPSDTERAKQQIKAFYAEKGYLRTEVDIEKTTTADNRVNLTFKVDRREKVEVETIDFVGNEMFDDGDLRGAMDETKENRWWRFWKGEKFKENAYEDDLESVVDYYNARGYYDARIVSDSVYYSSEDGIGIRVEVQEGQKYYVRNIDWEGNTIFPDRTLTERLGLEEDEPWNGKRLEENLLGNREGSDVMGLYMDQGYMRANIQPTVRVVGDDSLDITFDVREGEIYNFGDIQITGNNKTKSHVIRRELYTVPGQRFSRSAIQESIRRLMQLKYFSQESLAAGPDVRVDEQDKQANLTYNVEEVGSDQVELSGTYGRQLGLILQLGFQFNNFSIQNLFNGDAWRPLPTGDGQKLGVNVRTNGTFYQSYSLSFTEPWFRGRPTPLGGSISYSRFSNTPSQFRFQQQDRTEVGDGRFTRVSGSVFYERRLGWPDDKFSTGTTLGFQLYNNVQRYRSSTDPSAEPVNRGLISSVPPGRNQLVTIRQSLTRNSQDNPLFPRSGSKMELSLEVAPPIGDLQQYHKWRLNTRWNLPMGNKFSLGIGTDFGYIGSLTGEDVGFERFEVGGTPFDYSGYNYGTDPVFVRGFPARVIGPRANDGQIPIGGTVLNKYTAEFRWKAVESQQLQAQPYLFADAANTWIGFDSYNPSELYRAAGVGLKIFLPIVGMIEVNYGYNFDSYVPLEANDDGVSDWTFQFSLGRGFN
ncbi:outer membrane protein assembly factor BamA [Longibacter salinarum]|uniref:Outer membrane protein assembly factor BamA n=1 Tax=Longibacter salinarum TaxID=1850348 RepID=A0A2A8CWN0_9BACT|nr:outer membrane protein assembly factor BamA [Longibacter salinarum]PEN12798.1 outer membrane protein assembly factor BamA [Longibacter salinarum]